MSLAAQRPIQVRSVSFGEAFKFWLKLGFISFGGPAGQIAVMHAELVERRRWISEGRFLHALNYCMLLPGPEAQQLATYIGWLLHRKWGGVVAGVLFVLPSLFVLILLAWLYVAFGAHPIIAGVFYGIKPTVVAIVLHAAYRIGIKALRNAWLWTIAALAFAAIFALHVPFPLIVVTAALLGYLGGRFAPTKFLIAQTTHAPKHTPLADLPAIIDDNQAPPTHARFTWSRFSLVAAAGALLWLLPMTTLYALYGWSGTLTQMSWFFTKAALLTFGGAYAILPYVYQGAVMQYGWLTSAQMIDGLALGETTPGPLIMIVTFVGFVGGYTQSLFGPEWSFAAGATAAVLVTWFTFLPSFIFILAGGPLVESTRDNLRFTAPLAGITAAVVGVILNLSMFFGYHVLWPKGFGTPPEWSAIGITAAAAIALFVYQRGVIQVIIAGALLGLLTTVV